MADFQVRLNSANIQVRSNSANNYTVTQEKTVVAEFLSDLADVSATDLPAKDNYVLSYNASTQKYELVPADQVLQAAVSDSNVPSEFVNQLDIQLDNKIDMDAGGF